MFAMDKDVSTDTDLVVTSHCFLDLFRGQWPNPTKTLMCITLYLFPLSVPIVDGVIHKDVSLQILRNILPSVSYGIGSGPSNSW